MQAGSIGKGERTPSALRASDETRDKEIDSSHLSALSLIAEVVL
jgi:hypothetical protein